MEPARLSPGRGGQGSARLGRPLLHTTNACCATAMISSVTPVGTVRASSNGTGAAQPWSRRARIGATWATLVAYNKRVLRNSDDFLGNTGGHRAGLIEWNRRGSALVEEGKDRRDFGDPCCIQQTRVAQQR